MVAAAMNAVILGRNFDLVDVWLMAEASLLRGTLLQLMCIT
jgi:hypothetical protein